MDISNAIYLLKNQSTAYDIDKVVEELEKESFTTTDTVCGGIFNAIRLSSAIEIVKQGGVSDDVCEWELDSHLENDTPAEWLICPHNPKKIFPTDIKYCPFCGKKIKVVE